MAERFFMDNVAVSKNRLKAIAKLKQRKYRESTGLFIAEGEKALEELIEKKIEIVDIFSLSKKEIGNYKIHVIEESEMKKISSTDSVCNILAVAKQTCCDIHFFKKLNRIILVDSAQDPGNLGTIIRSAAAFGVGGIILYGDCVDLYSPKVIRSTAGNFFKIPIIKIDSLEILLTHFKNHVKIATSLSNKNNISLKECAKLDRYIIMLGSEARGLNESLIAIADRNLKLELQNGVESLNLGVCASIIMYELQIR